MKTKIEKVNIGIYEYDSIVVNIDNKKTEVVFNKTENVSQYEGKEIETWKYWENIRTGEKLEGEHYKSYAAGAPIEPVTKPYFHGWVSSLEIGLVRGDKGVPIGFISGLTDEVKANHLKYKGCPIEVTCMEVLPTGGLRHAKLVRFRPDLAITDCNWSKVFGE